MTISHSGLLFWTTLYRLTIRIRTDDTIHPNTIHYSEHYSTPKRIFGTSLQTSTIIISLGIR